MRELFTYRSVVLVAAAVVLVGGSLLFGLVPWPIKPSANARPIISQILAEPNRYDRKRVIVYGLVIDASSANRRFVLQDVSQMPLTIYGDHAVSVKIGDQVLVEGIFHARLPEPALEVERLTHTKVLGGGGCC